MAAPRSRGPAARTAASPVARAPKVDLGAQGGEARRQQALKRSSSARRRAGVASRRIEGDELARQADELIVPGPYRLDDTPFQRARAPRRLCPVGSRRHSAPAHGRDRRRRAEVDEASIVTPSSTAWALPMPSGPNEKQGVPPRVKLAASCHESSPRPGRRARTCRPPPGPAPPGDGRRGSPPAPRHRSTGCATDARRTRDRRPRRPADAADLVLDAPPGTLLVDVTRQIGDVAGERAGVRIGDDPGAAADQHRHDVARCEQGVAMVGARAPVLAQPAHALEAPARSSRWRSPRRRRSSGAEASRRGRRGPRP